MEVEETGEKRTSWYDTFYIYYASTLGCYMLQIGAEKYPRWLSVLHVVSLNFLFVTSIITKLIHVTYLYDIVEQKLILMYFARAWRINK